MKFIDDLTLPISFCLGMASLFFGVVIAIMIMGNVDAPLGLNQLIIGLHWSFGVAALARLVFFERSKRGFLWFSIPFILTLIIYTPLALMLYACSQGDCL